VHDGDDAVLNRRLCNGSNSSSGSTVHHPPHHYYDEFYYQSLGRKMTVVMHRPLGAWILRARRRTMVSGGGVVAGGGVVSSGAVAAA